MEEGYFMEKKRTIFDYLAQVLIIFGFSMLLMNIFCLVFGNAAKDFSSMFALGDQGIPAKTAFQFLGVSVLTVGARYVFFTDIFVKKMPVWLRTLCMLTAVVIFIAVFVTVFHWFPVNMWLPWAMFFLSFAISFLGSCLVMITKEKLENKRMEEALQRLKATEGKTAGVGEGREK